MIPRDREAALTVAELLSAQLKRHSDLYAELARVLRDDPDDDGSYVLTAAQESLDTVNRLGNALHALASGTGYAFKPAVRD